MTDEDAFAGLRALLEQQGLSAFRPKPLMVVWDLLPSGTHLIGPRHDWMFLSAATMAAVRERAQADAAGAYPQQFGAALMGIEIFDMNAAPANNGQAMQIRETVRIIVGRIFEGVSPRDIF